MQMSRLVAGAAAVLARRCGPRRVPPPQARQTAPRLSRQQRATLESGGRRPSIRRAADAGAGLAVEWQVHVLRASDGSHYVALRGRGQRPRRAEGAGHPLRAAGVARGARRHHRGAAIGGDGVAARQRSDPLPMSAGRSMTVPQGEMPIGGAAAVRRRRSPPTSSNALRYMDRQREQAAREREARREEAPRRARECRPQPALPAIHPFEDFESRPASTRRRAAPPSCAACAAGPGDFDLYVALGRAGRPATGRRRCG